MCRPRRSLVLARTSAGMHIHYIHNRIPLAIELAGLLGRHFELQSDNVILPVSLSVHRGKIERAAGNCIQNAHQCALRVAIADVKDLHVVPLKQFFVNFVIEQFANESMDFKNYPITKFLNYEIIICPRTPSPKAPLPPEPWDKRLPRERNQTPATPPPVSAEICRWNLLLPEIPDTPPWQPHSTAMRESC